MSSVQGWASYRRLLLSLLPVFPFLKEGKGTHLYTYLTAGGGDSLFSVLRLFIDKGSFVPIKYEI